MLSIANTNPVIYIYYDEMHLQATLHAGSRALDWLVWGRCATIGCFVFGLWSHCGVAEMAKESLLGGSGLAGSVPPHLVTYAFGDKRRKSGYTLQE